MDTVTEQNVFTDTLIDALPFDALSEVFVHLFRSTQPAQYETWHPSSPSRSVGITLPISQVCRRWRHFALVIPELWSSVRIIEGNSDLIWEKLLLERSKRALVDVEIFDWVSGRATQTVSQLAQIFGLLLPHIQRWRSLNVCLRSEEMQPVGQLLRHVSAPALELLAVKCVDADEDGTRAACRMFGGVEGLCNLRRWSMPVPLIPPAFHVCQMGKLQVLRIDDIGWKRDVHGTSRQPNMEDIAFLLERCPHLETLIFVTDEDSNEESINVAIHPIGDSVVLRRLISLKIGTFGIPTVMNNVVRLLACIKAPLIASVEGAGLVNSVLYSIPTSNPLPALQKLHLRHDMDPEGTTSLSSIGEGQVHDTFSSLPFLKTLILQEQHIPDWLFERLERLCPILHRIALDGCKFLLSSCADMLQVRIGSDVVSMIETLRIQWELDDLGYVGSERLKDDDHLKRVQENVLEFIDSPYQFSVEEF